MQAHKFGPLVVELGPKAVDGCRVPLLLGLLDLRNRRVAKLGGRFLGFEDPVLRETRAELQRKVQALPRAARSLE